MTAATIANQINSIIASVLSSSPLLPPPIIPRPDTLKGIDDLIRDGFDAYRASCFGWLLRATALVVVGLVFEAPELCHDVIAIVGHWKFRRRNHFSLPEEHAPNRAKLLAAFGWLFIVVGVAGEYVADGFVSRADGYVQRFDEILLTDATKQAGSAARSAHIAQDELGTLQVKAGLLNKQLDRVKAETAFAKEEASALDAEVAATEYSLSARYVIRFDTLVEQLSQFQGRDILFVSHVNDLPESRMLCNSLASAAQTAKMNVSNECGKRLTLGQEIPIGVVVSGPDGDGIRVTILFHAIQYCTHLGPSGIRGGKATPEFTILVGTQEPFLMKQVRGVKAPAKALPKKKNNPRARP